jgi:hypothetical protein
VGGAAVASRGVEGGADTRTLTLEIPEELARSGRIDLRRQVVQSAPDLAQLAQIYRAPAHHPRASRIARSSSREVGTIP